MNLAVISIGVLLGWSGLLVLPWVLSEELNPMNSAAGYVMLGPLLIPLWFLGESGGARCPTFTHRRLSWINKNTNHAIGKFLLAGWFHGAIFAVPSAVIITLAAYLTLNASTITTLIVLTIVGLTHLALFLVSFFAAIVNIEQWGRRIYRSKHQHPQMDA